MAQELAQSRWRIDPTRLPGPDREQILYVYDSVTESPSGALAALVYSIAEVTNNWYVGVLAVLCGDPANPRILLRPDELYCTANTRWLGSDRYLSVQTVMYEPKRRIRDIPFCVLDLDCELYTFYPVTNPCVTMEVEDGRWVIREWQRADVFRPRDGEIIKPEALRWLPWSKLDRRHEEYKAALSGRRDLRNASHAYSLSSGYACINILIRQEVHGAAAR